MRDPGAMKHLEVVAEMAPPLLITSVGSPAPAMRILEGSGVTILSDVVSLSKAEKAISA